MAITVRDIQEKEFATAQNEGYDADQVDDFLDQLAEDWGVILDENQSLHEHILSIQEALDAAQADKAELEKKLPDYNEKEYFQNLERGVRESLIAAQRIADEAMSEAKRKAQDTVDKARQEADRTVAEANEKAQAETAHAQQVVAELNAEADRLRGAIESYRTKLKTLISEHLAILGTEDKPDTQA